MATHIPVREWRRETDAVIATAMTVLEEIAEAMKNT